MGQHCWLKGSAIMPVVKAEVNVDELLAAVKQLSVDEIQEFERKLAAWRTRATKTQAGQNGHTKKLRQPISQQTEAALIAQIKENSGLPAPEQRRFNKLRRKRQLEDLTEAEQAELQKLWQKVEQMHVMRLEALVELAQRRGTDAKTVLRELGLKANRDVF
jgi:hypothetical protein